MTEITLKEKAKAYLQLCYQELNKVDLFEERWLEVQSSIDEKGVYELLDFELDYGTKVAWRNSNKCIGRLFWRSMEVLDKRALDSIDAIFDVLFEHIDFARVKIAAKLANIYEFIEKTRMGFNSMVGERGINLSGGQLQRIGLARAFYSEAEVLIIDEGTSALDQKTERDILTELKNNSLSKTVFLVTHRLSSLRICNKVIEIENKMTKIYRYKDFQIKRSK